MGTTYSRRYQRVPFFCKATLMILPAGTPVDAYSFDISLGGVGLDAPVSCPRGTAVRVSFYLKGLGRRTRRACPGTGRVCEGRRERQSNRHRVPRVRSGVDSTGIVASITEPLIQDLRPRLLGSYQAAIRPERPREEALGNARWDADLCRVHRERIPCRAGTLVCRRQRRLAAQYAPDATRAGVHQEIRSPGLQAGRRPLQRPVGRAAVEPAFPAWAWQSLTLRGSFSKCGSPEPLDFVQMSTILWCSRHPNLNAIGPGSPASPLRATCETPASTIRPPSACTQAFSPSSSCRGQLPAPYTLSQEFPAWRKRSHIFTDCWYSTTWSALPCTNR